MTKKQFKYYLQQTTNLTDKEIEDIVKNAKNIELIADGSVTLSLPLSYDPKMQTH